MLGILFQNLPSALSGPLFTLCSQADIGYNTCRRINSTRLSLPNFRIHRVRTGNRSLELWRRWATGERTLVDTRASQNQRTMWMSGTRADYLQRFSLVVRSRPWSAEQQGRGDNLRYQSWGVPSRYLHILYTTKFESCAYNHLETFPSDDEVMYNYGAK